MIPESIRAPLFALSTVVVVFTVGVTLDLVETGRYRERARDTVREELSATSERLARAAYRRVSVARELLAFAELAELEDRPRFDAFARRVFEREPALRGIALDPEGPALLHASNRPGQPSFILGIAQDSAHRSAVARAQSRGELVVAGPYRLERGGAAIVGILPFDVAAADPLRPGARRRGLIAVSIDLPPLLEESGIAVERSVNQYALYFPVAMERGEHQVFGNPGVLGRDPVISSVALPNAAWRLAAAPRSGWPSNSPMTFWLRGIGDLLAILAGVLVWRMVSEPQRLRRQVELASEAIRRSEGQFRSLMEGAPDALVIFDEGGRILVANLAAERLFGFGHGELLQQPVDVLGFYSRFAEIAGDSEQWPPADTLEDELDLHARRRDGSEFPIDLRLSPLETTDGQVTIAAIRDISERRRAESDRSRLAALVEHSNTVISIASPTGLLRYLNPAGVRRIGAPSEALCNQPFEELFVEGDRERLRSEVLPAVLGGQPWEGELSLQPREGGAAVPVEARPFPLRDPYSGAVTGVGMLAQDITERRRTMAKLYRLERAVEQTVDGIAITDLEGLVLYANPALAAMHGLDADSLVGASLATFHTEAQFDDEVAALLDTAWKDGGASGKVGRRRSDGANFPSFTSIALLRDEQGRDQGFVSVARDMSRIEQSEAELREALVRAEQAGQVRNAILQNVGHEVRTPLIILVSYAEEIASHLRDKQDDSMEEIVEEMQRASKRLLDTMQGVLDLSKMESGSLELRPHPFDIGNLVEAIAEDSREIADDKGLRLDLEIESGLEVFADETALREALRRIVDNALKFTAEGSIEIAVRRDGDIVSVVVRDSGVGIAAEFLPRAFEPFSQEESGSTRHYEGTGIGLAVARRYAELCSGSLALESEQGRGTTATLRVPAAG